MNKRGKIIVQNKYAFPEIKQTRANQNSLKKNQIPITKNTEKFNLLYQQPLSSLLISKKVQPTLMSYSCLSPQLARKNYNSTNQRKQTKQKINIQHPFDYFSLKSVKQPTPMKRIPTSFSHKQPKTANIELQQSEQQTMKISEFEKVERNDQLTFFIDKANNNEQLIRNILKKRKIWRQVKWGECIPNFKWLFFKSKNNYKKMNSFQQLKSVNKFQYNEQITTKDLLIKNLQIYCQTKKVELFSITPITFIIDFDDEYCQYNTKQFLNFFYKNDPRKQKKNSNQQYHFVNSFINKFSPYMAWQNPELKKNINSLSKPLNNQSFYSEQSYIWLLKPTGLNRGRGIQIFDSIEQLQKYLLQYMNLMNRRKMFEKSKNQINPQCQVNVGESKISAEKFKLNTCSFVIQKYVEKPFLINSRKFDIRVWILLTHQLKLFIFKQAYIRTSTEIFSTQNIDNYFIHLTNNAIQKNSQNYGQFESGNQLSFKSLAQLIGQQKTSTIWQRIKKISYMTFSSVKKKINLSQRKNCFEVFGLDYIIDEQLKVWLIEVNQNPCIECSSPLLSQLIPRMINDAFKLTVDLIYNKRPQEIYYPVDGYNDKINIWQGIGMLSPNAQYSSKKME